MRQLLAIATCVGLFAGAALPVDPAVAQEADNLIALANPDGANRPSPMILRGSAVKPKGAPKHRATSEGTQIVGGRQMWFFDPATETVSGCLNRQTSTVGVREIRCTSGTLGRYHRGFGPAFSP